MTLTKTHTGRYKINGVPELQDANAIAWVVKDGDEWHVMRFSASMQTSWITTGHTRTVALELAAERGWRP